MARTWSNAKKTDNLSAAQKARNRPSSRTAFIVILALVTVFFIALMITVTLGAEMHPPTVQIPPTTQQPKDD